MRMVSNASRLKATKIPPAVTFGTPRHRVHLRPWIFRPLHFMLGSVTVLGRHFVCAPGRQTATRVEALMGEGLCRGPPARHSVLKSQRVCEKSSDLLAVRGVMSEPCAAPTSAMFRVPREFSWDFSCLPAGCRHRRRQIRSSFRLLSRPGALPHFVTGNNRGGVAARGARELERLARYVSRPPVGTERLWLTDKRVERAAVPELGTDGRAGRIGILYIRGQSGPRALVTKLASPYIEIGLDQGRGCI